MPQAGSAASRHRVRPHRGGARRDRRDAARHQVSRRLPDRARGYICENYGAPFRCPTGAIGANGLANARDFLTPVAAFEDAAGVRVIAKFGGTLWTSELDHSPLDVVAWHGNYAPYKYDLARFMTIERSASTTPTRRSLRC